MSSPNTAISVCIARVFKNISKRRIQDSLNSLALGDIERIDLVKSQNPKFNTAFIHFHRWNPDKTQIREAIVNGTRVKVIYDQPWFWLLSLSRSTKPTFESKSVPKIVIESDSGQPEPQTMNHVKPARVEPAGTPPPSKKKKTPPVAPRKPSNADLLEQTSSAR